MHLAGIDRDCIVGSTGSQVQGSIQSNLANGNYSNLETILNTLNYSNAFNPSFARIPRESMAACFALTIRGEFHRNQSSVLTNAVTVAGAST